MICDNVTCDVCGIEKKEANHWFTAYEDKGALNLCGGVLSRKRQIIKHLCGQACVHRLMDIFMAGHSIKDISPNISAEVSEDTPSGQTANLENDIFPYEHFGT
jgi:hypothetical protein